MNKIKGRVISFEPARVKVEFDMGLYHITRILKDELAQKLYDLDLLYKGAYFLLDGIDLENYKFEPFAEDSDDTIDLEVLDVLNQVIDNSNLSSEESEAYKKILAIQNKIGVLKRELDSAVLEYKKLYTDPDKSSKFE